MIHMSTVNEHYQLLLSKHYTWMFGLSFEEKVKEQKELLLSATKSLKNRTEKRLAVDLGSGSGFQTLALAELGFAPVIAVDSSAELLKELRSHADGYSIETTQADLRDLSVIVPSGSAAAVVCMGDTLTHLPSKADVRALFKSVCDALYSGGLFVITYRDLTMEMKGNDRFLPIRSDADRIMTCFLEYTDSETVVVHDLVHTRDGNSWKLNKSSYRKLRLSPAWMIEELAAAGLLLEFQGMAGKLVEIVTRKP
jgi:SAM-dependent methyltransferase